MLKLKLFYEKACVTKKLAYISTMNKQTTPHTMETFVEKLARLEGMMQHCLREAKKAPTKTLRDKYINDFYMYSKAIENL